MSRGIDKELREHLERLPLDQQRQVLDFVRSLRSHDRGDNRGSSLKRFSGLISEEDLAAITRAVDEGCERVNPDEW